VEFRTKTNDFKTVPVLFGNFKGTAPLWIIHHRINFVASSAKLAKYLNSAILEVRESYWKYFVTFPTDIARSTLATIRTGQRLVVPAFRNTLPSDHPSCYDVAISRLALCKQLQCIIKFEFQQEISEVLLEIIHNLFSLLSTESQLCFGCHCYLMNPDEIFLKSLYIIYRSTLKCIFDE